jgi:hypothetical protein
MIGAAMVCLFILGSSRVNAQTISYSIQSECLPGHTISIEFNEFPGYLKEKLAETIEANQQMFASYEITPKDKVMRVVLAYEDMRCNDFKLWLDSYLRKWEEEMHEDILNN